MCQKLLLPRPSYQWLPQEFFVMLAQDTQKWEYCAHPKIFSAGSLWPVRVLGSGFPKRKRLFTGRLSGYKKYLTGRLPGYKKYLTDRLSGYKKYLTGRLYLDIKSTSQIHYLDIKITSQVQFVGKFIHIKPLEVSHNLWKASTSSSIRGKLA